MGLVGLLVGSLSLALVPSTFGVLGYQASVIVMTAGYGLFQTANNTAAMKEVRSDQRGVVSGLLNLSRNLGLVTGASVMGAVFAWAAGGIEITSAHPAAVAMAMRATFAVAAMLIVIALSVAVRSL